MDVRAAVASVLTLIAIAATYIAVSFQLAYPEGGAIGWLMIAGIVVAGAVAVVVLLRTRKEP